MSRSSARSLPYDIRPAKQTERRLLLDYLSCAKEAGVPVSRSRYVGMGGVKFYDFILMHKFVGLTNMVSLEHDQGFVGRCEFNKPYEFIRVLASSCSDFISQDLDTSPTVYWLDYDGSISDSVINDIQALGVGAPPGSFVFVTVMAGVPRDLASKSELARLASIKEQFGDLAAGLMESDMEESAFPTTVHGLVLRALVNAFAGRDQQSFFPSFRVAYGDGAPMITVGGYFGDAAFGAKLDEVLGEKLPFLNKAGVPYRIFSFNLTERERILFEFACGAAADTPEKEKLLQLGFKDKQLLDYRDLLRFVPRYFETMA